MSGFLIDNGKFIADHDTKDTAIAASRVTTLDRVAVSGREKGMIYIKWGRGKGGGCPPANG